MTWPWPEIPDEEAYTLLQPILARGKAAMRAYVDRMPSDQRLIAGGSVSVVLRADFVSHADICLRHVVNNRRSIYVLAPSGALCALLSRETWERRR